MFLACRKILAHRQPGQLTQTSAKQAQVAYLAGKNRFSSSSVPLIY